MYRIANPEKVFFISDTHFGHYAILKHSLRPFVSATDMDQAIIENWNNVVSPKDDVFHLGDFCWGRDYTVARRYRDALNGNIHLIMGNHDRLSFGEYKHLFGTVTQIHQLMYGQIPIILCHFGMRVWNRSHFNSWHLYGHSHGKLQPVGKTHDVGVDNNGFKPVSLLEIEEIMKTRDNNFNYVEKRKINAEQTEIVLNDSA